jgi:hypothetical protein
VSDAGYVCVVILVGALATTTLLVDAELAHAALALENPPAGAAPLLADTARARSTANGSPEGAAES